MAASFCFNCSHIRDLGRGFTRPQTGLRALAAFEASTLRSGRLLLAGLARLDVVPLFAQILQNTRAEHPLFERSECSFYAVAIGEGYFNHVIVER